MTREMLVALLEGALAADAGVADSASTAFAAAARSSPAARTAAVRAAVVAVEKGRLTAATGSGRVQASKEALRLLPLLATVIREAPQDVEAQVRQAVRTAALGAPPKQTLQTQTAAADARPS